MTMHDRLTKPSLITQTPDQLRAVYGSNAIPPAPAASRLREGTEVDDALALAREIVGTINPNSPEAYWKEREVDLIALVLLERWLRERPTAAGVDSTEQLTVAQPHTFWRDRFAAAGPDVLNFAEQTLERHFVGPLKEQEAHLVGARSELARWEAHAHRGSSPQTS